MTETDLKVREPAHRGLSTYDVEASKLELASVVQQLVEKDPEAARRLLLALRDRAMVHQRRPMMDTFKSFGLMASLLAEAVRPTPLRQRPASLTDTWTAVGSYIQHGIREMDKRLDARG